MAWKSFTRVLVGLCGAVAIAAAQTVTIPDGPRHFVLVVDRSRSVGGLGGSAAVKHRHLEQAEKEIVDSCFGGPGKIPGIPRFRPGKDLMTVLHFGMDTSQDTSGAFRRIPYAHLRADYMATLVKTATNVNRKDLARLLRPQVRTCLNVLGWAFPLAAREAAVGQDRRVQDTLFILLNDGQMNDGSITLERENFDSWLNKDAKESLKAADRRFAAQIDLKTDSGIPGAIDRRIIGSGEDMIDVFVFRANSPATSTAASAMAARDPFADVKSSWIEEGGTWMLQVSIDSPAQFSGRFALLQIDGADASAELGPNQTFRFKGLDLSRADQRSNMVLHVFDRAKNPMLGNQVFEVVYTRGFTIPPSPVAVRSRFWLVFSLAAAIVTLLAAATWLVYEWFVPQHFRLYLPGLKLHYALPAISQRQAIERRVRTPRYKGESAFTVVPPSRLVCKLLYRKATLECTGPIAPNSRLVGAKPLSLLDLPKIVDFVWLDRPDERTTTTLKIVRPTLWGRPHTIEVKIRHTPLPWNVPATAKETTSR